MFHPLCAFTKFLKLYLQCTKYVSAFDLFIEMKPFNVKVSVNCPPDTDTPGFANEQVMKPEETHLISEGAGLFQPDQVAKYAF